ncbi:amidase signature domain-containing protein [Lineolata rhizophorae]|uniref:amidase n=1 Tax=Lineolata rhizophorae TaxID=578093 RepID=A0A6A6P8K3_9PEZI|nr:amidase signature domain-containing protein [Lineolata rhizophorae]
MKQLGAVILCKTNLPQSIMWCETENPLWGLTVHPDNPKLTPGGSSGGEAALLALHGSLVGWGTDIGGSVRIPAHMLGLYGLKPSATRLPYHGVPVSTEGQEHVPSVIGPLTRGLSSLRDITKAICDSEPWRLDPKVVPLPWRPEAYEDVRNRRLSVGLLVDDGVVKVHPPIERVLREVAAKMSAAGHEVIAWDGSLHKECINIMDAYYTADGGEDIRRAVSAGGEPFLPHVHALITRAPPISVFEYWQLNRRKLAAQKAYLDKWNGSAAHTADGRPVDVLLTPSMPHTAVPHRTCRWVGYTKVWNFLGYAAVCVPAGRVEREKDPKERPQYEPRNEADAWNWELYDLEQMEGLPVSVQVVGRKLEEEKVLGVAEVVERVVREEG